MQRACVNDGCDRTDIVGRGMCNNCYHRWRRAALAAGPLPPAKPKPRCGVEGCERPHYGNGWCRPHGRSFKTHGDPLAVVLPRRLRRRETAVCSIDGCERMAKTATLCSAHYARKQRHGDPLAGKFGSVRTLVSAAIGDIDRDRGACWIDVFAAAGRPYVKLAGSAVPVPAARYVLFLVNGEWPDEACHKCDNDRCWNPDHLYAGTRDLNRDDAVRRGRTRNQHKAAKP